MKNLFFCLLLVIVFSGNAQTTAPQKGEGSLYSITSQNLRMAIDTSNGARISSFQLSESELLYVDFSNNNMAGSTFWPSPQSVWNWPPLENLDSKPYSSRIDGNKITFKGATDSKTNLRFYKTMYASESDTSVVIEYTIKNEKSSSQKWAPWEITRVVGSGLTVFEKGDVGITGILAPSTDEVDGYIWYDQDNNIINKSGTYKFIGDGKGWLAHVVEGGKLFIKQFDNIPNSNAAPSEGEVEVYTAFGNTYTELENQGTYVSIPSKDSVTWKVKWIARQLPSSVDVSVGSSSLVSYIEAVLARSGSSVSAPSVLASSQVNVFPNPATDYLTVEAELFGNGPATLQVYTLQGKLVLSESITLPRQTLSVANLPGGTYLYQFQNGTNPVGRGLFVVKR